MPQSASSFTVKRCSIDWLTPLRCTLFLAPFLLFIQLLVSSHTLLSGSEGKLPFNEAPLVALKQSPADLIFIGNSMLKTRIHDQTLANLTGKRVQLFKPGGGYSALWYLILKNWVVASGTKPEAVFVFFRLSTLTNPTWRTDEKYKGLNDTVSQNYEPEFNQIVYGVKNWRERVHGVLDRRFLVTSQKTGFDNTLRKLAFQLVQASPIAPRSQFEEFDTFSTALNDMFSFEHVRNDIVTGIEVEKESHEPLHETGDQTFYRKVKRSFLPSMIRIAKEHSLPLHFVLVKSRNFSTLPSEQKTLGLQYLGALEQYLSSHGMGLHSYLEDPHIELDWFGSGDHIAISHREKWTQHFAETTLAKLDLYRGGT